MSQQPTRSAPAPTRRKAGAFSSPPETLRQALYQLVHQSGVSFDRLAEAAQVKTSSYLYNAANPNLEEEAHHAQMRWLVPLTQTSRNFVVIDFIEHQLGRVGVMLPTVDGPVAPATPENLPAYVCHLMAEIGDVARESSARLADGDLSHVDRRQIEKEVRDVMQKATQILQALKVEG